MATETIQTVLSASADGTSLAFQDVDQVHGSDSLPLGVLREGDGYEDVRG